MATARAPQLLVGPDQVLSSVIGLYHFAYLQLVLPSVYLHTPWLIPVTSLHCHVPMPTPSSHGRAHTDSQSPPQLPGCPQLALACAAYPGAHQ